MNANSRTLPSGDHIAAERDAPAVFETVSSTDRTLSKVPGMVNVRDSDISTHA